MSRAVERGQADCDRAIEAITRLRRSLPELERRNRYAASGDGYSSSSFGLPGQKGSVSQPTERSALSRPQADPVRRWTREAMRALDKVGTLATDIDNLIGLALAEGIVLSCVNCGRAGGRLRDSRCDACYTSRRRNGVDRAV